MGVSRDQLIETYRFTGDEDLVERLRSGELTGLAREVASEELARRGLLLPDERSAGVGSDGPAFEPSDLVTLARFTEPWEAHILQARLEAEGIFASVADQHLATANWFYSNALGGVRVQVPASQLQQARTVEAAIRRGDYTIEAEPAGESAGPACPKCGSRRTRAETTGRKVALFALWLIHIPVPFRRWQQCCDDCGHRWRVPSP